MPLFRHKRGLIKHVCPLCGKAQCRTLLRFKEYIIKFNISLHNPEAQYIDFLLMYDHRPKIGVYCDRMGVLYPPRAKDNMLD